MRLISHALLAAAALLPGACTPVQDVETSRESLWQRYGGKPLDALLLDWGAPDAETRLSDGARLVKYRRSLTYDAGTTAARSASCEVSFLAGPTEYRISNIAMQGSPSQCYQLSQGKRGDVAVPAPIDPYPYGYRYGSPYGGYRYRF